MKQFEYQTIVIDPKSKDFWGTKLSTEEIDKLLNEKGNEGWELVSVQAYSIYDVHTSKLIYTFKREKR